MAEREYRRLTWARRRTVGLAGFAAISIARSSLWLGRDHVLVIDSTGYNETYKRFYFRDIQAITICKTQQGKFANLACGVIGGVFGLFAVVVQDPVGRGFLLAIAGLFLLILLINLAAGPTSATQIRTAVQTEDLPSLNRLRRARRVLKRLRPLIAAEQGELTPEQIAARLNPGGGQTSPISVPNATAPGTASASVPPPAEGGDVPPRIVS